MKLKFKPILSMINGVNKYNSLLLSFTVFVKDVSDAKIQIR
jgi:hypothetical protein